MTIVLYHMPGACSRVTMSALEEIGVDYQDRIVALAKGAQRDPAYLALNPKGKVPTLVINDEALIENAAILFYLARRFPEARLLPSDGSEVFRMRGLSDLIWCSGTLHPLLHRLFRTAAYVGTGDVAPVKAVALHGMHEVADKIAPRLAHGRWWYGAEWSIVDTYLDWILSGAQASGFPREAYPDLIDHHARVGARPAFQRTLAREKDALLRDVSTSEPAPLRSRVG